jgi:hypothetical protein
MPEGEPATVIRWVLGGRLGNRMFEVMAAHMLARRLGGVVTGEALPEWGIAPAHHDLPARHLTVTGHRLDLPRLRYLLGTGLAQGIETSALACRMELLEPVEDARALFAAPPAPRARGAGEGELLINIRAGNILGPLHRDYRPLPLAFYARLIAETGLRPVFLGQIARDPYSHALRARFPGAEFRPSEGPMQDFAAIRASRHICTAISTFSWLAAWLSQAETIHLPIAGMFHPGQRPDVDLLPLADARYRFHLFPVQHWGGTPAELAEVMGGEEAGATMPRDAALRLAHPMVAEPSGG